MYYEINVSKETKDGYSHYFATAPRSITNKAQLILVAKDFSERFPAPEFNISVRYVPEVSVGMEYEAFAKNPEKLTL